MCYRPVSALHLTLVLAAMLCARDSWAQESPGFGGAFGGYLALGNPQGEFGIYVDQSFGLGGFFVVNLDRRGIIGLRLDGSYLIYGLESVRRPLSLTVRRVQVDVTTYNQIISGLLGPQLTFATGSVRPYVYAGAGFSYFFTESGVSGSSNFGDFARSTNFDDLTFAWAGGGGLQVRVSRRVGLEFSVQYVHNGRVRYLREGSIYERADGSVWFRPIASETNLVVYKVGVSFF